MRIVTTKENTYGFEIEFCTHDNTILRYTHIEIAKTILSGDAFEKGNQIPLKLETDSGDVLELVTPPIIFNTPQQAAQFRNELAKYLKETVARPTTFEGWWSKASKGIIQTMNEAYTRIMGQPGNNPSWIYQSQSTDWIEIDVKDIALNLSVNNIDDGINIAAAKLRMQLITEVDDWPQSAWKKELKKAILSASSKDWPIGYSTQTSIPMQGLDYVKYVIGHKLLKSNANLRRLETLLADNQYVQIASIDKTLQWETVERWATTWFWGGVIFDLFVVFLGRGKGGECDLLTRFLNGDNLQWSNKLGQCNKQIYTPNLNKEEAAIFIIAQKTLTGALGALSERSQLKKQQKGYQEMNAAAMEQRDYVRQPDDGEYYWCEYHSSLKDLLGVWFKGHLADVLIEMAPNGISGKTSIKINEPSETQLQDIYTQRLKEVTDQLEKLKRMRFLPEFTFIPDDSKLAQLVKYHLAVIEETAAFLSNPPAWFSVEKKQKFLEYSSGGTFWEGRKDTMIDPIYHINESSTKYETFFLVEHRNN
ncbi:hypothetical protein [Cylindrospermum sp. FACHB-282]|uniref:hypothetical protein n=1 Tax=Cylindrospermum sp. FACHB-282 TaxID=2692794 RepID=UPI001681D8A8|nr:hypothetical protein [Cylindrospermum sp. FACHB-282]MBD2388764.1 hypothetical protein [Cylindrospermum sp. FACHB-282]